MGHRKYRNTKYRPYKEPRFLRFLGIISLCALFLFVLILGTASFYFNDTDVIATVDRKEAVNSGKSHTYLIFTNKGVFENNDILLRGIFNSSDIYNLIKEGKTYKFTLVGQRIPFLSMYKNIVKVAPVN